MAKKNSSVWSIDEPTNVVASGMVKLINLRPYEIHLEIENGLTLKAYNKEGKGNISGPIPRKLLPMKDAAGNPAVLAKMVRRGEVAIEEVI